MKPLNVLPLKKTTISCGKGSKVYDSNCKEYLDLQSGYWCSILGYGNPAFVEPIKEQLTRLTNVMSSFATKEVNDALDELGGILSPELTRVTFLSSGSEAVDLSLKIARAVTRRTGVVVNECGYYGATSYPFSLSVSGRNASYLPDPGEVHRLPAPRCHTCSLSSRENCKDFRCLNYLQNLLDKGNTNIAAIIYEPILGYGILVPPIGYGAKLRDYADKLGALLISEEVSTAPAKTGRWFAYHHDEIVPDILVLGKAIGNGFPVSLVITTEKVNESCKDVVRHVQSHQNDAISGRVVQTVLSIIRKEGLVQRAANLGDYWLGILKRFQAKFTAIEDVRGRGLMFGVQLTEDAAGFGESIQNKLVEKGFLMDYHTASRTFRFFPPLVIDRSDVDNFNMALETVLEEQL